MTSTIKVNTVKDTASTDIIKKCGTSITVGTASDTTTVAGNAVRSNAIQASDGQNIISQTGTTITLGASGDTIALSAGANQTGFGRTGTVDWQTGSIKTSTFTAVNGEGYFANTSGGAFTMNLPAGSAGAIVSVVDYTSTFQTNALTIAANGSEKIGGSTLDVNLKTEGQSVTLVYVDGTEGWVTTADSTENVVGDVFISACVSGSCNTQVTCGNFKTAIFKGPGTFTVNSVASCAANNVVDYLVVAGGGGGGKDYGGAGGAGGFRSFSSAPGTGSPLNAPAGLTVTATGFPITVGAGSALSPAGNTRTPNGSNSIFSSITSAGGGGGAGPGAPGQGAPGGSGAGGSGNNGNAGGAGNTPPVSPPQGRDGGNGVGGGSSEAGGGGAGAGGLGANAVAASTSGAGGIGEFITPGFIGPTAPSYGETGPQGRFFAGGGGGGGTAGTSGPGTGVGGLGGGGDGSSPSQVNPQGAGIVNTGGGGGGQSSSSAGGGAGGSGIVIIRYKFQ